MKANQGEMESIQASVSILGRKYHLRVPPNEEESLRRATESIETLAKQYGNQYAYNDHQDLLAMVALTKTTQLIKIEDSLQYKDNDLDERLRTIDGVIEAILHPTRNSL